jgi:hypothetical protein
MANQRVFKGIKQLGELAVVVMILLGCASPTIAQETATILGVVKDASGAAVPGTNVTARNVDTAQTRATATDVDGSYRLPALPVGNYEVRAEHAGLKTALRTGLVLTVAQDVVVNITLEVGSVDQTVEVTAEAPLVNTTSNSLGGLVDEHSVVELPLNGRSYVDLTFLTAGVIDNKNQSPSKGSVGHYFSSNGATPRSNNYLLDGATMVTMYGASSASIDNTTLGIDGVQEYRVVTNSFSAEYGQTMGSQMLISSKGGTNTFHGSAFEFLRNSIFDAKNPFDVSKIIGRRLPEFQRNDFGASFGGPIKKDKTFFFAVYEGLRENKGITTVTNDLPAGCTGPPGAVIWNGVAPAPATFNSTCTQLGGKTSSTVAVASQIVPFLAMYPSPNLVATNQYTFPYQQPSDENYGQIRLDHNISTKDTLFGRYTADNSTQESPLAYPGFTQGAYTRGQFVTLSENHIFSPAFLNTARTSFSRTTLLLSADVAPATASIYNNPATQFVSGYPEGGVSVSGFTGAAAGAGPIHRVQNIFQYSDDAVYSHGKHSLKFGFLINHYQQFIDNDAFLKGSITFASISTFLQALPSQITAIEPGGSLEKRFHYNTLGLYGQDDVRVTQRLTLNLGLRYEIETTPKEIYGNWSALVYPLSDASMTVTPKLFGKNPSLKNLGPRIGFAWDVFGNGKTSVRGGFALLYDIGNYASDILQTLVAQTPFTKRGLVNNPGLLALPFTFTAGNLNNAVRPMDYFWGQPRLNSFNLTIERQLPFDMGLSVAYVGSRGYKLDNDMEGNPTQPSGIPGQVPNPGGSGTIPGCVAPPTGHVANYASMTDGAATACWLGGDPRINHNFGTVTDLYQDTARSWYNSLQVSLTKRLTKGLQFQAAYTWSKDIDQNPGQLNLDTGNSNPLEDVDPLHIAVDQGRCACDVRNNFKFNTIYYLPNIKSQSMAGKVLDGWWVSSIVSLQSGYPFSPDIQVNRSLSGTSGGAAGLDRPDLVPGRSISSITSGTSTGCGNLPAGTPIGNVAHWFDPCAFTLQPAGFLGNAGRNILNGPGFADVDISLVKDTPLKFLGESGKLQFRSEFFNILNHANFALPSSRVSYTGTASDVTENPLSTAGTITATISTSRQIQFAVKVIF